MILVLSIRLAAAVHRYLQTCAPSNILIRHVRRSGGRLCAFPVAGAAAAGYLAATAALTAVIERGAPGWLNLFVLVCAWNAIRCWWIAVLSLTRIAPRCWSVGRARR